MSTRVVHCNKESYDVYIGRPSKWGNPFTHITDKDTLAEHIVDSREEAIGKYREYILNKPELLECLDELDNKILGCWCKPKSCHGDILVELLAEKKFSEFLKNKNETMICDKCKKRIVLHAFSDGTCEKCNVEITTSHIPCDKVCNKCSEKYNCCRGCGNEIKK